MLLISSKIKSKYLSRAYTTVSMLHFYLWKGEFHSGKAQYLWDQTDLIRDLALSLTHCVTLELSQSLNPQGLCVLIPKIRIIIMGCFQE